MRREKIIVFCIVLLLCIPSVSFIVSNNATADIPDHGAGDVKINGTYIYQIAYNLSRIIFQYPTGELPKGRSFGSFGEHYAANEIIKKEMMNNLKLYNPGLTPSYLQQIQNLNGSQKDFASILEILAKNLTINHSGTPENVDCFISPRWTNETGPLEFPWNIDPKNLTGTFNHTVDVKLRN